MDIRVEEHPITDEIIISGRQTDDDWYWHELYETYYTPGYGRGTWCTEANVWVTINYNVEHNA
jgi:hypothetical protein